MAKFINEEAFFFEDLQYQGVQVARIWYSTVSIQEVEVVFFVSYLDFPTYLNRIYSTRRVKFIQLRKTSNQRDDPP